MKNIEIETRHMNVVIRARQQWDATEVTYHRGNGVCIAVRRQSV